MKKILPHLPTILIIVALVMAYFAFNQLLTNNGELKAKLEASEQRQTEIISLHQKQNEYIRTLENRDLEIIQMLKEYEKQIKYIQSQENAIFRSIDSLRNRVPLPDL